MWHSDRVGDSGRGEPGQTDVEGIAPDAFRARLGDRLDMHEVAEATAGALSLLVLPAARLAEVGDWGKLGGDRLAAEPPVVECVLSLLCVFLVGLKT